MPCAHQVCSSQPPVPTTRCHSIFARVGSKGGDPLNEATMSSIGRNTQHISVDVKVGLTGRNMLEAQFRLYRVDSYVVRDLGLVDIAISVSNILHRPISYTPYTDHKQLFLYT